MTCGLGLRDIFFGGIRMNCFQGFSPAYFLFWWTALWSRYIVLNLREEDKCAPSDHPCRKDTLVDQIGDCLVRSANNAGRLGFRDIALKISDICGCMIQIYLICSP